MAEVAPFTYQVAPDLGDCVHEGVFSHFPRPIRNQEFHRAQKKGAPLPQIGSRPSVTGPSFIDDYTPGPFPF